jgi:hypothetical protein
LKTRTEQVSSVAIPGRAMKAAAVKAAFYVTARCSNKPE